jgi:nickel-dependent lactate racemase
VVSDNVLNHQGSHVGASHCQEGQGGKVYDVNKKIIRAYSKRNRKRVLSSKSSKIKSSLLRKKKSRKSPPPNMNMKQKL